MTFDDLYEIIKGMTKKQRTTDVCVFEVGSDRYILPVGLNTTATDPDRPYLEGMAVEAPSKERDPIKPNPTSLDAAGNRPHRAKPTGLDASLPTRKRGEAK